MAGQPREEGRNEERETVDKMVIGFGDELRTEEGREEEARWWTKGKGEGTKGCGDGDGG